MANTNYVHDIGELEAIFIYQIENENKMPIYQIDVYSTVFVRFIPFLGHVLRISISKVQQKKGQYNFKDCFEYIINSVPVWGFVYTYVFLFFFRTASNTQSRQHIEWPLNNFICFLFQFLLSIHFAFDQDKNKRQKKTEIHIIKFMIIDRPE